jgi:hypothetical protein
MADPKTTAPAAAAKAPAAPKPKAEPKPPRYPDDAVVTLLKDTKDGKQYGDGTGDTKNPKRGKSGDRFKNYRSGQTIAELRKASEKTGAGYVNADLDWDLKHGMISIKMPDGKVLGEQKPIQPPKPKAEAKAPAAAAAK